MLNNPMDKFLQLCEMYDPANVAEMNAAWEAKNWFHENNISFSSNRDEITIHGDKFDIVLKVVRLDTPKGQADEEEQEASDAWDIVSNAADDTRKDNWAKRKLKSGFSPSARNKEKARKIVDTYDKKVLPDAVNAAQRKLEKDKRALRQQYT